MANDSIDVLETRLSNGLGVLLKADHTAPIVSFWTWYRVGSRNEIPGQTGISHWVEHLQFKGTSRLAKGQIFRDVSRVGGTLNALTSHDWTAYFETVPASEIDLPIRIESDRMMSSTFDPEEVELERTVIISERQGAENNPGYALYEEVTGAAFRAHPYRHMVIGYEADLRRMTRDELFAHYRRFYHPGNAFIVAVGDFDSGELLSRIERAFGSLPAGAANSDDIGVVEPVQPGERRVLLCKPAGAPYLRLAFHAPAARHPDLVPLLVTEAIVSGAKPMGFGGGGGMGRSSRLYRALVASGLARSASSDMSISLDPFLFQIGVTALPGGDLRQIEQIVEHELEQLRTEPVSDEELVRAIRQLEAQFVYSSEGVTNQAYWLGQWNVADRWARAESLPAEMRAVTASDVQRVAREYLSPVRQTVGWLEPEHDGHAEGDSASAPDLAAVRCWGLDGPRLVQSPETTGYRRTLLPNGIPVLGQERPGSRSIALRMRVRAGSIWEPPHQAGLAHLTARGILRGAAGRSFDEISKRTDELGAAISIDAGREFAEVRLRALRDDLPELATLLADALSRPDLPASEVEHVRAEQLGAIAESDNHTRATADRLMRGSVYPAPNPLGRRTLGTRETVVALNRNTVATFHAATYGPIGSAIAIVGGMGSFDHAVGVLADAFGAWPPQPTSTQAIDLSLTNERVSRASAAIPGKSQTDLAAGLATIARGHPDFYALEIGNVVLGRLGLMGRLGEEVRGRQGLAYYAFSQLEPRRDGSLWSARAGVDPANVERALQAIHTELERLRSELIADEELSDAKQYLVGVLPLTLESHDGVASMLLAIEEFGLGLDYVERYPSIIAQVSREAVLDAARRHLDPDRLAIGMAGPRET